MSTLPGTHVHTANHTVPPLNDDLTALCEDLTGFHPGIDQIVSGIRHLALTPLDLRQTQAILTVLQGSTDRPGEQIDIAALTNALIRRLLNPAENPCLRDLPADVQEQAIDAGREVQAHDADFTPRHVIAKAVYELQP